MGLFCSLLIIVLLAVSIPGRGICRSEPRPELFGQGSSLQFGGADSKKFRIALFADLHYGENAWTDWGPRQDDNSDRVMSTVLGMEKPDFVIYLGDLITANNIPIPNATLYWDRAISPTRSRGIPWATVFGNHDDATFEWPSEWFSVTGIPPVICPSADSSSSGEDCCEFGGTKRLQLMEMEVSSNKLSYSKYGPKELRPGVSNYILQISSSRDIELPAVLLYFLDSGGGSYPQVISSAQVTWFKEQAERLNPEARIPEIVFWHIPTSTYKKVAPVHSSGVQKPCVGSINKEAIASQEAEWGIMDILVNRSSVKATFVGHNHGLDWCCPYESLWLCFARHTGYGGYGNWARGSRIIEITEQSFSIETWIRMEDGSLHGRFILS